MKNSLIKGLMPLLLIPLIAACDDQQGGAKGFAKMLEEVSNKNITFRTDYQIYYYEKGKEKNILQRHDVTSKMVDGMYDMVAYNHGTNDVTSSAHLEKDENGYVAERYVDIHNEINTTLAKDGTDNPFLWEESVYINQIGKLKEEHFDAIENDQYIFNSDLYDLNEVPLTLLHTAIPTTSFDLESLIVTTKDDKIESFIFQEKDDSELYEGYLYSRTVTVKFENIGTTEITAVKANEVSNENDALGLALQEMQNANNFTIVSDAVTDTETTNILTTYVTKDDVVQEQNTMEGLKTVGLHTVNNELYSFSSTNDLLLGRLSEEQDINNLIPSFDFSKDVFKYDSTTNGTRVYKAYSAMEEVLDYVDYEKGYSGEYSYPSGDICLYVKDNHLTRIEFPIYMSLDGVTPTLSTMRISYQNVNSTTIDPTVWDSFVTDLPNQITSWDDISLEFTMMFPDGSDMPMTPDMVIESALGDVNALPFFLPSNASYTVSGEILEADNQVSLSFESTTPATIDDLENINFILEIESEFTCEPDEMADFYTKGDIDIMVMLMETGLSVEIYLPIGDLLA